MTDAVTVTNEELAILCDIVAGWSVKRVENLDADKRLALDRLIANGFVEQARWTLRYKLPTHRQNRTAFHTTLRRNKRRLKAGRLRCTSRFDGRQL